MKRVAIVGHPDNIKRVDLVIKDSFSNIESFPIEMIDMSQVQTTTHFLKEHIDDFDGVIFTGKILYDIMNHNMHSQNPWVYLKNDDSQLQRALIKAMLKYDHDITQISIDSYPEETVRQIYADLELDQNLYHTNVSQINIFNESLWMTCIIFTPTIAGPMKTPWPLQGFPMFIRPLKTVASPVCFSHQTKMP